MLAVPEADSVAIFFGAKAAVPVAVLTVAYQKSWVAAPSARVE